MCRKLFVWHVLKLAMLDLSFSFLVKHIHNNVIGLMEIEMEGNESEDKKN